MKYSPALASGILVQRYKRFLTDISLADGRQITIHCPNTGSMKNCATPGDRVWYSTSDNAKRKYPHTWELNETRAGDFIGINTLRANALVREAVEKEAIPPLAGYQQLASEVKYGNENSRIDLLLSDPQRPACYVEVKSVTLCERAGEVNDEPGIGYFPDAVSVRGTRHLRELAAMVAAGHRAVLIFCVQHSAITQVRPAHHIDPVYADALITAVDAGVEVYAFKTQMSTTALYLDTELPVVLGSAQ